ncbi:MAG: DM13 domain-containing protein [Chloroflexota bacterium]
MLKRPIVLIGGLVGLIIFGYIAWWLAAPLFVDDVVDEAFPFDMPSVAEVAAMSDEERQAAEADLMEAMPSMEEVAAMSEDEKAEVETAVMEAAAVVMTDKEMEEEMPEAMDEWVVASAGQFVDADAFHQGSGNATIYQQGNQRVLRFEDFEVTNGPDLHVLLSTSPDPTSSGDIGEYIDLGQLKGNQGSQNYEIPDDVDLSQYQSVVIYCMPFHVVFSTATLN